MANFPSLEWFEAVRKQFNSEDSYRHGGGGRCDCDMGVQVGKKKFIVVFEGFECQVIKEGDASCFEDVDFYLSMGPSRLESDATQHLR